MHVLVLDRPPTQVSCSRPRILQARQHAIPRCALDRRGKRTTSFAAYRAHGWITASRSSPGPRCGCVTNCTSQFFHDLVRRFLVYRTPPPIESTATIEHADNSVGC